MLPVSCAALADGVWSKWTSWSECTKTCFHHVNDVGFRRRFRSCNHTLAAFTNGSSSCVGDSEEQEACNAVQCPGRAVIHLHSSAGAKPGKTEVLFLLAVNGGWSTWSQWSKCSSKCDSGVQIRERFCNSPSPVHGGRKCQGAQIQTRDCNSHPCAGTPATTATTTLDCKRSHFSSFRRGFKSMRLRPQAHARRGWCT